MAGDPTVILRRAAMCLAVGAVLAGASGAAGVTMVSPADGARLDLATTNQFTWTLDAPEAAAGVVMSASPEVVDRGAGAEGGAATGILARSLALENLLIDAGAPAFDDPATSWSLAPGRWYPGVFYWQACEIARVAGPDDAVESVRRCAPPRKVILTGGPGPAARISFLPAATTISRRTRFDVLLENGNCFWDCRPSLDLLAGSRVVFRSRPVPARQPGLGRFVQGAWSPGEWRAQWSIPARVAARARITRARLSLASTGVTRTITGPCRLAVSPTGGQQECFVAPACTRVWRQASRRQCGDWGPAREIAARP